MEAVGPKIPSPSLEEDQKTKKGPNGMDYIHFYMEPPSVEMSLDQFEIYALKRLKVLRHLERYLTSSSRNNSTAEKKLSDTIKVELKTPEIDIISHFILRAAYSLDEEKRRWFLKHESALFQFRLERANADQLTNSCKMFHLIPINSKDNPKLIESVHHHWPQYKKKQQNNKARSQYVYKLPFTQALDLVARREVIVEDGYAYIPDVVPIITGRFRMQLSANLAHLAQNGIFPNHDGSSTSSSSSSSEQERLFPLLKNMNSCLLEAEPSDLQGGLSSFQSSQVTPANIPKLVQHMPLCMRNMQNGLRKDKKLRYHGRLQYGLFLKGAGLSLEESMLFFQKSFSNMTPEQWTKEYAYNIRHTYGKEGQKKSKSAYNCSGIMNSQPPSHPGDHHGCPYKNYDADKLSRLLQSLKIGSSPAERMAIVNLQKSKHYNLACLEHFKVMHPNAETMSNISVDNVGNHPNAWFRASMAYEEEQNGGGGGGNGGEDDAEAKTEEDTISNTAATRTPDVEMSS